MTRPHRHPFKLAPVDDTWPLAPARPRRAIRVLGAVVSGGLVALALSGIIAGLVALWTFIVGVVA